MVCEWGMLPGSEEVYLFSQPQRDAAQQQWLNMGQKLAATMLRRYIRPWKKLTARLMEMESLGEDEVKACLEEE